ncbi:hypothetical protein PsorP6_014304 [Peronosclerospora sorghi]|uniref:Uncharacterized protein n=1 Tax=Peronosclerospora sorghi TaxID=230839 RepID=A0ACC0VJS0_9STRA|nr:hypothetical protein PsorP6_014304 [Peronosclerospora sorghi]
MISSFSDLDLALDPTGAIVSNGRSAAKDLLVSKSADKQAEAARAASQALLKKQQQQDAKKTPPVTALSQAMDSFEQELEERDAFLSRKTKRRQKRRQRSRGGATTMPKRQQTYLRV